MPRPGRSGAQGHANVSHGCTGMSDANAKWMYDNSQIGDVVVYRGQQAAAGVGQRLHRVEQVLRDWSSTTT